MRVVVTGATGNVGSALLAKLAADPAVTSVVGIARRPPSPDGARWVRRGADPTRVSWVAADVRQEGLADHFEGADAVVHLAWIFQPTHDPLATWDVNVRGSTQVFAAAATAGVGTLVHASSVGAYRAHLGWDPVDERWPTDALPTAAYGREKSYLERVLDRFELAHPEVRVVRMRPGFTFQRAAATAQWHLFAGSLVPRRVRRVRLPLVPLPPELRFQALHADAAAEAYRLALYRDVRGAFNLVADPVLGPAELAAAVGGRPVDVPLGVVRGVVAAAWHARLLPVSPQLVDLVAGLPVLDVARAREELGWSARHRATDALAELVAGLRLGSVGPTPALGEPDR